MIIHIKAFGNFREILGKGRDAQVKEGSTIRDLLSDLSSSNPRLKSAVFDESGMVRDYIVLTRNGDIVELPEGLDTELKEGDEVAILPPIVGG